MKLRKILLYGSGNAREHCTLHALKRSQPGVEIRSLISHENALLQQEEGVLIVNDLRSALAFADEYMPDDVFVLSPIELISGAADSFRAKGFKVFGVSQVAAKLEQSKIFAKGFMRRHQIPTPDYYSTFNVVDAQKYLQENWIQNEKEFVIKTDFFSMNAYDRTVTPTTLEEAITSIQRLFKNNPGTTLIIEEKIQGFEVSLHILVDGERYYILPPVKDYKKLLPYDEGPMTHGVASVASSINYPPTLLKSICKKIIEPTLLGLKKDYIDYKSILYIGLMCNEEEPKVLEYNVRSGNPEWLSLMGLLDTSLINLLDDFEIDKLNNHYWKKNCISVSSFGMSSGYPESQRYKYTEKISGLEKIDTDSIFGESIIKRGGFYYPSGGRVFAVRYSDSDFENVCCNIKNAFNKISMEGLFYRTDLSQVIFSSPIE